MIPVPVIVVVCVGAFFVLAAWVICGLFIAVVLGRSVRIADERPAGGRHAAALPVEVDLLADQPVEVLSDAEVARRLEAIPGAAWGAVR